MSALLHLADRILNRPLLIMPEKASLIAAVLGGRIGLSDDALAPFHPDASRFVGSQATEDQGGTVARKPFMRTDDGIGIVTVTGSLVNRGAWVGASSGLTSYEGIKAQLSAAASDSATRAIVLDLHTPGGEATGAFEAADIVRQVAAVKPVIAVVNGMAASAGYALASAATKIVTTTTGVAGSIGVVLLHADYSRSLDKAGVTPTMIFAGDHKVDGNPFEPLPDDVKASLQAEVDNFYALFVQNVTQGRKNLSPHAVKATQARTFIGQAAVDAGLADELGSFESVLADLSRAPPRANSQRTTGASRMSVETITPEIHTAAIASARQDGEKAGITAERERFAAIINHPQAEGRRDQAVALALTGATVDMAAAMLATVEKTSGLDQRATAATAGLPNFAPQQTGRGQEAMSEFDQGASIAKRFTR
ncbi:S49 family peptidase [Lichenihabitans sp. PAMC28606]|uniref:S49 family peptidase n=1 Tax=Lichenihabitans sp. PAMC28606 TaxID=2880932 RepID=UPI001D09FACC|nr:S49 family peptidase [Lichenihabitans sp. PAMC28606]UDL95499.1 S49 family peptidase [Lichenihabitans sp. PAMC28606]